MKKLLIVLGAVLLIVITAIVVLPMIFKDDIQKALDDSISESLDAKIYYDVDQFDLSLLQSFPNLTVSIADFGVVGLKEFSEDTLASIANFQITIDLMSIIGGNQIKINEILLEQPSIYVHVLENGKANYDIAKSSTESSSDTPADSNPGESTISLAIDRWAITDGEMVYDDQSLNFSTIIVGLNHEGAGDFTLDVFDLTTSTTIESLSLGYDGVDYISNKQVKADVTLAMDLSKMLFTFKDNKIAVNDFAMGAEGFISMPDQDIDMDITFGGNDIDLKSILSLIPGLYQEYLDGVTADGQIDFNGYVRGTFNETSMPQIAANLSIANGLISYADFNIPMEAINLKSNFNYPSTDLRETSFNIDNFSMLVDGEKIAAYLNFKNLENYTWNFGFEGNADLEKITKIVPLEEMTLRGRINAKLKTAGKMSDLEAERYAELPTNGSLTISDFRFSSPDLPQGFGISKANVTLTPSSLSLTQFDATSGNSDFSLTGQVTNYIGYALSENEVLAGKLVLASNLIDINEFMPEELEENDTPVDTTALEIIRVPENIDFTFSSNIKQISYTNLAMKDFQGQIIVRDGAIILDKNTFNMLEGSFELSGLYVTKDLVNPKYDFGFKIKNLSIASSFESFETVQKYVPIAKQVTGNFSTDFHVNGLLGTDMMPLMDQINLQGLVNVVQATLKGGTFMNKLNTVTALKPGSTSSSSTEEKKISLKDVLIATEIKDGRLFIEPFDLQVNGQKATLGGSNTLDGQLDYSMLLRDIPTGAIGAALNTAIGSLIGGKKLVSDKINLNLAIGGTYDDVQVKLLGTSQSGSGSTSATAAFKQELSSKVGEEKAKVDAEIAKKKAEAQAKAKAASDSAKVAAAAKKKAVQDSINAVLEAEKKKAEEAAKSKVKDLFKKKGGGK